MCNWSEAAVTRHQAAHSQLTQMIGLDLTQDPLSQSIPATVMAYTDTMYQLSRAMVGTGHFSPTDRLDPNYITDLRNATVTALRDSVSNPEGQELPLQIMLRHSLLLAYAEVADHLQPKEHGDPGFVDIYSRDPNADPPRSGQIPRTRTPLRLLDGQESTLETLKPSDHSAAQTLEDIRTSLDHLANVPIASLEMLLRETLDLASHRLDAWITSLATARLHGLRQTQPKGVVVGGYGWVENLRKIESRTSVGSIPTGEDHADFPLGERTDNGGYVAAPSLNQAATAAILRSGYLNHNQPGATAPFAIDLSSERVRLAQWLLDGVRNGQALGALLGYRFERLLREQGVAEYIEPFRRIAPFGELYRLKVEQEEAQRSLDDLIHAQTEAFAPVDRALKEAEQAVETHENRLGTVFEPNSINGSIKKKTDRLNNIGAEESDIQRDLTERRNDLSPLLTQRNNLQEELNRLNDDLNSGGLDFGNTKKKRRDRIANTLLPDLNRQISPISRAIADLEQALKDLRTEKANLPGEISALESEKRELEETLIPQARENREQKQQAVTDLIQQQTIERQPYETRLTDAITAHDNFIETYRNTFLYPPTADTAAIETIEAQHVTDGLQLMKLWQADAIPFEDPERGLPPQDSPAGTTLQRCLNILVDNVDAVSDLVTAESVYQLTLGNELRAGATLDAIAKGETPPPEMEVVTTPRSGIAHTHRVSILLPSDNAPPPTWRVDGYQRRGLAEPALNHWLASMLGPQDRIRIRATYYDAQAETALLTVNRTLHNFFLSPLDVVYLATTNETGIGSPLESVLAYRLMVARPRKKVPVDAVVRFSYDRDPNWEEDEIGLGTFLEIARAARELITSARPLDARDFVLPHDAIGPHIDTEQLKQRADGAVNSYEYSRRQLDIQREALEENADLNALRVAIFRFCFFDHPNGVPASAVDNDEVLKEPLLAQMQILAEEADARLAALAVAVKDIDRRTLTPEAEIELDLKRLQIIFGDDFRVLPQVQLPNASTLQTSFDQSLSLQGQDPLAAISWLDQMAHVREGSDRLQTCLSYTEVLQPDYTPQFKIGQLPYESGDRWVGLPLDPQQPNDVSRLSLVTLMPTAVQWSDPLCGLMVDEWVETIPNAQEIAGVGFHFDAPQSQPPHAILLAVPPDHQPRWQLETLESIVLETLELAKLRTVDNAALFEDDDHSHFLPALYFAQNPEPDTTVSSDFSQISAPLTRPIISRITPSSSLRGRTVTVTIAGAGLANPSTIRFSESGISVRSVNSVSDAAVQVELSISSRAAVGPCTVQVTTPNGELNSQDSGITFRVESSPPPSYGSMGASAIGANLL